MNIYESVVNKLFQNADEKYREFNKKIVNGEKPMIGVRAPVIKKIAKEVVKDDAEGYKSGCKFAYFEDSLIYGLVVGAESYGDFKRDYNSYLAHADSWADIDMFVPSIKCLKKPENALDFKKYIDENILRSDGFYLRFYIVALMSFYLTENYVREVLSLTEKIDGKGYYNDMAIAWLISFSYVKFRETTLEFLKNDKLSEFTHNKAISKINDSFRVSKDDKQLLKSYMRKRK